MARPQRNTVDYFPFYCDEGEKMFYIEETYGNDGFAVFVKLLRELAKAEYHYLDLSKKTTVMFLSAKCKVTTIILEQIISDLVELGKFDAELWSESKIIWCESFIDSIKDAYSKRSNKCIDRNSLLELLSHKGIYKHNKITRKHSKSNSEYPVKPQTILEYTKEDETIENKSKVKTLKAFKEEVHKCYDFVLEYFPENTRPKTDSEVNGWKETIEQLNRLDGIDYDTIIHATKKAREDSFWSGNFLSINKLRKKDSQGVKYINVFIEKFKDKQPSKNNSYDEAIKNW